MRKKIFYFFGITICLFSFRFKSIPLTSISILILSIFSISDFLKYRYIKLNLLTIYYLLYFFSIILTLKEYNQDLFLSNLKSISTVSTIFYLLINTFLKINLNEMNIFIKGLKIGIILNLIYATGEFILWEIYNFKLNEYIFGEILKIDSGGHVWTNINYLDNSIRIAGFSWDPLTIGMLSSLGIILFNNKYLKLYSFIILLLSQSRSGLIGFICVLLIKYIKRILIREKKEIKLIRIFGLFFIGIFFIIVSYNILNMRGSLNSSLGDKRRRAYYISALKVTTKDDFISNLFGGSPNFTGNVLANDKIISKETYLEEVAYKINWQIESDWVLILIGRGWIGLFCYMLVYILGFLKSDSNKIKEVITLFFFLGIGYYYEKSLIINIILIMVYKLKDRKKS